MPRKKAENKGAIQAYIGDGRLPRVVEIESILQTFVADFEPAP